MNDTLAFLFPVGLFAIVITIAIAISHFDRKATNEAWGKFAEANSLTLWPGSIMNSPRVGGMYRGLQYSLHSFTQGSGKSKTTYTGIDINLPSSTDFNLHIYRETFLSKIGKAIGFQDIQFNDKEFDDAFIIKSNNPEKAINVLTPDIRKQMLSGKNLIHITVNGVKVHFQKVGNLRDINTLNYLSELLWHMANNISGGLADRNTQEQLSVNYGNFNSASEGQNICPSCNSEIPSGNKFCINCGKKM